MTADDPRPPDADRWTLRCINGLWWLCKNGQQQRYATENEVAAAHADGP